MPFSTLAFAGPASLVPVPAPRSRSLTRLGSGKPRARVATAVRCCVEKSPGQSHAQEKNPSPGNDTSEATTGVVSNAKSAKGLSASERMLQILGKDDEESVKKREEKKRLAEEQRKKDTRVRNAFTILGIALGVGFASIEKATGNNPLMILERMEQRSAPLTAVGNGKPTMIEVYAPWCGNCKASAKGVYDLELSALGSKVNFITVNADKPESADLIDMLEVDGIPHYALLDKEGKIRTTLVGDIPAEVLRADLQALTEDAKELPYTGLTRKDLREKLSAN